MIWLAKPMAPFVILSKTRRTRRHKEGWTASAGAFGTPRRFSARPCPSWKTKAAALNRRAWRCATKYTAQLAAAREEFAHEISEASTQLANARGEFTREIAETRSELARQLAEARGEFARRLVETRSKSRRKIERAEEIVAYLDRRYELASGRSPRTRLRDYLRARPKENKEPTAIRNSAFFDRDFYLNSNPDVRAAGGDPAAHYLACGGQEGRDPSPFFSTHEYLAKFPDVAASGLNALAHYELYGRREMRSIPISRP